MMKRFGKSIGYLFYFLIVQIIVTYAFLFYKFATDMNWVTEMYSAFVDNGLFSTEYLGYVMELTIPSLIVSDIVIPIAELTGYIDFCAAFFFIIRLSETLVIPLSSL